MISEYFPSTRHFRNRSRFLIVVAPAAMLSFFFRSLPDSHMLIATCFMLSVSAVSFLTGSFLWGSLSSAAGLASMLLFSGMPVELGTFSLFSYPFVAMMINALIISRLVSTIRARARLSLEKQAKADKLTEISNELLSASEMQRIVDLILDYSRDFSGSSVIFYQKPPRTGIPALVRIMRREHETAMTSYHEKFIVQWVFENKKKAGVGTDFCGRSCCVYLPLISHAAVWGVLGIYCEEQKPLEKMQLKLLNSAVSQTAMTVERQHLTETQQQITLEAEKEYMRANLLRAVSHDLRTPLTGMIGSSATLLEHKNSLTEGQRDRLIRNIHEDSNWLLHMVENLLSVTRISAADSKVSKTPEPLEEVVSEAVMRIKKRYPDAQIKVRVPEEFLMVPMDATLIEQVLINLTENSIIHSGSQKPTELYVEKETSQVLFHVKDYGKGLVADTGEASPASGFGFTFDGYSHKKNKSTDSSKGIGIGLSICKTIINAHGGTIAAQNHENGGALFTFSLPLEGGTLNEF